MCSIFINLCHQIYMCTCLQCLYTCLGIHERRFSLTTPWLGLCSLLPLVGSAPSLSLGLRTAVHPCPWALRTLLGDCARLCLCFWVPVSMLTACCSSSCLFLSPCHSRHTAASWVFSDSVMPHTSVRWHVILYFQGPFLLQSLCPFPFLIFGFLGSKLCVFSYFQISSTFSCFPVLFSLDAYLHLHHFLHACLWILVLFSNLATLLKCASFSLLLSEILLSSISEWLKPLSLDIPLTKAKIKLLNPSF